MEKPKLSPDFTLEDIRKLREYNHERRIKMTTEELEKDINEGAKEGMEILRKLKEKKKSAV